MYYKYSKSISKHTADICTALQKKSIYICCTYSFQLINSHLCKHSHKLKFKLTIRKVRVIYNSEDNLELLYSRSIQLRIWNGIRLAICMIQNIVLPSAVQSIFKSWENWVTLPPVKSNDFSPSTQVNYHTMKYGQLTHEQNWFKQM